MISRNLWSRKPKEENWTEQTLSTIILEKTFTFKKKKKVWNPYKKMTLQFWGSEFVWKKPICKKVSENFIIMNF